MKVGIVHHPQSWDKNSLTVLIAKLVELSLGIMVSMWVFQDNVFFNVNPRNSVLQVLAIFLFPCIIFMSIKELLLATNCI